MTSVAPAHDRIDHTELRFVVVRAAILGVIQTLLVFLFAFTSRVLEGPPELVVRAVIVLAGIAATTLLPGIWTRARTIEGIAGAAGIGLGAAFVFLLVDVILLQHIGTYTNRWWQLGGSNWWYHPIWWMVGTFLPWLGAWILANQVERNGRISAPAAFGTAVGFALAAGVVAVLIGFPGARWNLPTFGVAFLPGLALATALSALGGRRA